MYYIYIIYHYDFVVFKTISKFLTELIEIKKQKGILSRISKTRSNVIVKITFIQHTAETLMYATAHSSIYVRRQTFAKLEMRINSIDSVH